MLSQINISLLLFTIFLVMCGFFYFLYNRIIILEKNINTYDTVSESDSDSNSDSEVDSDSDELLFDNNYQNFDEHVDNLLQHSSITLNNLDDDQELISYQLKNFEETNEQAKEEINEQVEEETNEHVEEAKEVLKPKRKKKVQISEPN